LSKLPFVEITPIFFRSDCFIGKKYYGEKRKRALRYIHPHILYVGLQLGLGLSRGVRVRVGVRIR